jgi:replicative DNA helicase
MPISEEDYVAASKVTLDRIPPQNIDAERAVLGAMLTPGEAKKAAAAVSSILIDTDFYRIGHQHIYNAILRLFDTDIEIDLLTVTKQLEKDDNLEKVGGVPYLDEMIEGVPSADNVKHYAEQVKEEAMRRQLLHAAAETYNHSFDPTEEFDTIHKRLAQGWIQAPTGGT